MARFALVFLLGYSAVLPGCAPRDQGTTLVSPTAFNPAPASTQAPITQVSYAPAPTETAARVDTLGRKLLAANPQIGLKPLFHTVGSPGPVLCHRGTDQIFISDGLVKQCKTEGELAALLCNELGKMVSEREAMAGVPARQPVRRDPIDVPVGNDNGGTMGAPDQTHLAEMAKYNPKRPSGPRPLPPDPQFLATGYLEKAGYPRTDLDAAIPLMQAAADNVAFERQLTSQNPAPSWQR